MPGAALVHLQWLYLSHLAMSEAVPKEGQVGILCKEKHHHTARLASIA